MNREPLTCDRCDSALTVDDLRCPVCNLTASFPTGEDREDTVVEILRCSSCGAAMTYQVSKLAAACAFCGSVLEAERPADPLEKADHSLPFTVDRKAAESALMSWLEGLGWFRPGDLRTESRLESIQPLHWVGWVFDASAEISWAADTNHGTGRADWAPHAGSVELEYDDVIVPASRGLSRAELAHLTPSYDLGSAEPVDHDEDDPQTVERFDVPRSASRTRLTAAVERLARRRLTERHLPGTRFRNLHTATVLRSLGTRRCAFPAWVLAYRYRGGLYRTVLSGQDATCIKGNAPISVGRVLAVAGAAAAVMLLILALALL